MEVNEPDMSYGNYTYADYLKWTIQERFELIKGKVFKMSPAPTSTHQRVSGFVFNKLYNFLQGRPCEVFSAPFDVRLPKRSKDDSQITTSIAAGYMRGMRSRQDRRERLPRRSRYRS